MTQELIKEHQKFEEEINQGEHGTNSLARYQLAERVFRDLQDSIWTKKIYEKCLLEVKEENADEENYYYNNLAGIANSIYNSFDQDWAEEIFNEIFNSKNVGGMCGVAANLVWGDKADDESKKRAKQIFLDSVQPKFIESLPQDEKMDHLTDVISNLSVELNDHEAAKLVISIAESHVKTSDDMLTIGYCFSYTDQNTMRKYFNKAKEIAETGEQLFNIGMKYNDELEDIKTAKTICKEALTKFTSDEEEDKKYYENMFKEVYG